MLEALEHPHAFNVALELDAEYMRAFLCSMSLDPNAQSFLKICKKTMRPVCIITNLTTAFQIKKLQKLKITPYIDYLVTSEEAGIEKPAPSFFHYAIKKVNRYQKVPLEAKNILVLGDNIENDINGAKKLGMPSQHITLT